jgi:MFS family permease
VLREPSFYLLVVAFSLAFFVAPAISLHMIPYLTDQGISDGVAVAVVAVWSSSSALGSLSSGFLAERFSIHQVMAVAFVLGAAAYALLLLVQTATAALLWGLYFGAVQGGAFTLQHVIFADYYGRESLGAIRSAVWPVQSVANATGPLVTALAFDATGSYRLVFSLFVLANLASALFVFLAKPPAAVTQRQTGVGSGGRASGVSRLRRAESWARALPSRLPPSACLKPCTHPLSRGIIHRCYAARTHGRHHGMRGEWHELSNGTLRGHQRRRRLPQE